MGASGIGDALQEQWHVVDAGTDFVGDKFELRRRVLAAMVLIGKAREVVDIPCTLPRCWTRRRTCWWRCCARRWTRWASRQCVIGHLRGLMERRMAC